MGTVVGADEIVLPGVDSMHDVYPTIDPKQWYDSQTFKSKIVLITGASRGIGLETALQYARSGASLALVARKQANLDESKAAVLKEIPAAQVLTYAADVTDVKAAEGAVKAAVAKFGRLDILVANAGAVRPAGIPFAQNDPVGWWNIQEVNVRGVYNFVHFAVPELLKTKGQIVITTSGVAQLRIPTLSEYCTSKFTLGRLAEFIVLENPDIKVFNVHPGVIETVLNTASEASFPTDDTVALPAATYLYLTAGKADYLSGRYVHAPWNLGQVEKLYKEKIIAQNGLVTKLHIPV
ncbi:NAD-P-binding protein [Auriscalpium vulgare]|uniref:NAD-P-binding protein n=1 Tax=Auriscalpium vulgare TaxID=40419 RepID=A0ACB8RQZ1_9AGAM|nr:NAD-P-binding protein [Auriscalpium vulgare]